MTAAAPSVRELSAGRRHDVSAFVAVEGEFLNAFAQYRPPPAGSVETELWLAHRRARSGFTLFLSDDGGPAARCSAAVDPSASSAGRRHDEIGYVGHFAARPGALEATTALIQRAERWLAARGVRHVVIGYDGPGSVVGGGIRTADFGEDLPTLVPWHPRSYIDCLGQLGYRPHFALWTFEIDHALLADVGERQVSQRLAVRTIESRRWYADIKVLSGLHNEIFHTTTTPAEFLSRFWFLNPSSDPRLIQLALDGREPVGFVIAGGAPSGRSLVAVAGGLLPEYRRRHLGSLVVDYFNSLGELGSGQSYVYPVNDANRPARRLLESIGARGRITHHLLSKVVSDGSLPPNY